MTRARRELILLASTPYYHCISRCVRRAFLCGEDSLTGINYEHRKAWVTDRLRELAALSTGSCGSAATPVMASIWSPSAAKSAAFTPGILPSALRASLRLFKTAPSDFVSELWGAAHG